MSTLQELFAANAEWAKGPLTNGTALSLAMIIVLEIDSLIRTIKRMEK